jgi:integrase
MSRSRRFPRYPQKPHSSGQARIKIKGRPYYLGVFESPESWAEYRRLMTRWEKGLAPDPRKKGGASLVKEILAAYTLHAERYYCDQASGEPTKQLGRVLTALGFVRELFGERPVDEFDQIALEEVRDEIVSQGYYRKSVNSFIGCIRRAWKWGAKKKLIPEGHFANLRLLEDLPIGRTSAPESQPVKPVPIQDVLQTLPFLLPPVAAMVRLQMLTGMRPGEVLIMRPMDLERDGDVWLYRPGSDLLYGRHKNAWRGMHRVITLGPQCLEIIRPFLVDRPAVAYLFSPREALAAKHAALRARRRTKVQPSQQKRAAERLARQFRQPTVRDHYSNESYPRAVSRAVDLINKIRACDDCMAKEPQTRCAACRAELPHWHPNQLRHLVSTEVRKKYGPDAARAMLGQKSLKAAEIYAELDLEKVAEIMRQSG